MVLILTKKTQFQKQKDTRVLCSSRSHLKEMMELLKFKSLKMQQYYQIHIVSVLLKQNYIVSG